MQDNQRSALKSDLQIQLHAIYIEMRNKIKLLDIYMPNSSQTSIRDIMTLGNRCQFDFITQLFGFVILGGTIYHTITHDEAMAWDNFLYYWYFERENHQSLVILLIRVSNVELQHIFVVILNKL